MSEISIHVQFHPQPWQRTAEENRRSLRVFRLSTHIKLNDLFMEIQATRLRREKATGMKYPYFGGGDEFILRFDPMFPHPRKGERIECNKYDDRVLKDVNIKDGSKFILQNLQHFFLNGTKKEDIRIGMGVNFHQADSGPKQANEIEGIIISPPNGDGNIIVKMTGVKSYEARADPARNYWKEGDIRKLPWHLGNGPQMGPFITSQGRYFNRMEPIPLPGYTSNGIKMDINDIVYVLGNSETNIDNNGFFAKVFTPPLGTLPDSTELWVGRLNPLRSPYLTPLLANRAQVQSFVTIKVRFSPNEETGDMNRKILETKDHVIGMTELAILGKQFMDVTQVTDSGLAQRFVADSNKDVNMAVIKFFENPGFVPPLLPLTTSRSASTEEKEFEKEIQINLKEGVYISLSNTLQETAANYAYNQEYNRANKFIGKFSMENTPDGYMLPYNFAFDVASEEDALNIKSGGTLFASTQYYHDKEITKAERDRARHRAGETKNGGGFKSGKKTRKRSWKKGLKMKKTKKKMRKKRKKI